MGNDGISSCLACGQKSPLARTSIPGLLGCPSCGFKTADCALSDDELRRLYDENYFHGNEYADYEAEQPSLRHNFRRRIQVLKRLRPQLSEAEVFEVGCAYGYFLSEIAPLVRKARGIDISADAVRRATAAHEVDARQGDYLRFDVGAPGDIITMWDTIEHLSRPDLFVAKAGNDLRAGGLLAITTGDIGSLNARWRGRKWRMIHPPTHLHYFSVRSLSALLDRFGFDVAHVSHPGNARNLRSVLYFLTVLKGKRPALFEAVQGLPIFNLAVSANLFDIMYVVGRKR